MPKRPAPPDDEAQAARALVAARAPRRALHRARRARTAGRSDRSCPYAVLPEGDPVIWLSAIAEHTKNLAAEPRCCLLVNDSTRLDDVQAAPRVALLARAAVPAGPAAARAEEAYTARFPDSGAMASAHDFAFHVLKVEKVRWIAGFGSMGWLTRDDWSLPPDPLTPYAAEIAEHLNEDHADALLELASHFAGVNGRTARVTGVDAKRPHDRGHPERPRQAASRARAVPRALRHPRRRPHDRDCAPPRRPPSRKGVENPDSYPLRAAGVPPTATGACRSVGPTPRGS